MKKLLSVMLAAILCLSLTLPAFAATSDQTAAANKLYDLGLFLGVGDNADGTPNFDLDRAPNRAEAVTMLVRLLGAENAAKGGSWTTPFTDVPNWAKPYVGYAYVNGLTNGTGATTFGSGDNVSAAQYLTFVLRALGYESGSDFVWSRAWEKTNELKITFGEYDSAASFTRGDAVLVSARALDAKLKNGSGTLIETIGSGTPTQKTPDEILAAAVKKMNAATSYQSKSTQDAVITVTLYGESATSSTTATTESTIFKSPYKLKVVDSYFEEGLLTEKYEMYVVSKNDSYISYSSMRGAWILEEITAEDIEWYLNGGEGSYSITDVHGYKLAGTETIGGVSTTKYSGALSSRMILEDSGFEDMISDYGDIYISPQEWNAIYAKVSDVAVDVWVDSNGYIVKHQSDMSGLYTFLYREIFSISGISTSEISINFDKLVLTSEYYNFSKATDFELPAILR